ncbi:hypothetical protein GEMRC1_003416 [Eukaryota sp. GEM-RC1]
MIRRQRKFSDTLVTGKLSDKFGRRFLLLFCLSGLSLAIVLTSFATSVFHLVLARAFAGIFAGLTTVCQAYISDVTLPSERSSYLGLSGASQGVAISVGPLLGGILYELFNFRITCYVASFFVFLSFTVAFLWFENADSVKTQSGSKSAIDDVPTDVDWKAFKIVLLCTLFNWIMISNMQSLLPLTLQRVLDGTTLHYSGMMAISGITIVTFQWKFIKKYLAFFKSEGTAAACASYMNMVISLMIGFLYLVPGSIPFLTVLVIPMSVAKSAMMSTSTALASFWATENTKGKIMGYVCAVSAAGRATPLITSLLFDVNHVSPWILTSCLLFVAGLLFPYASSRAPRLGRDVHPKHTEMEALTPLVVPESSSDTERLSICIEQSDKSSVTSSCSDEGSVVDQAGI